PLHSTGVARPAPRNIHSCFGEKARAPLRVPLAGPIEAALMNIAAKSTFVLSQRDLLGIEGLSREDIPGLLDLADDFVELNRQINKKRAWLGRPTRISLFFGASTRRPA